MRTWLTKSRRRWDLKLPAFLEEQCNKSGHQKHYISPAGGATVEFFLYCLLLSLSLSVSPAQTSMALFKNKDFSVKRRFSDFLGLHSKLASKYLHVGYIVPPAPEKSIVGKSCLISTTSVCYFVLCCVGFIPNVHPLQEWPKWRWGRKTSPPMSL